MSLQAGSTSVVINCEIGDDLAGQLQRRICESIRDDLEANALYLSDGRESLVMISCDLLFLETQFVRAVAAEIESAAGVPAGSVLISCTHTHDGPNTFQLLSNAPVNERYLGRLKAWLVGAAKEAAACARPARVGWAKGRAHVGFNRRLCWADGTHSMYGDANAPDFTGLEGPDDPSHAILLAVDEGGRPIGLLHNNSCHATCIEAANQASADFPGEARRLLRETLGEKLPVLYLQGASGDNSPFDMLSPQTDRSPAGRERRLGEAGALLAGETLRLLYDVQLTDAPAIACAHEDLRIAVRIPSARRAARAEEIVAEGDEGDRRGPYVLQSSVLRLYEEFKDDPFDTVPVYAARIGGLAIATNPCELYCRFGLDIKRRSPAEVTVVAQLTNGFCGYCPTTYGILGGGYSGEMTHWSRLDATAGYRIVDETCRLLHGL